MQGLNTSIRGSRVQPGIGQVLIPMGVNAPVSVGGYNSGLVEGYGGNGIISSTDQAIIQSAQNAASLIRTTTNAPPIQDTRIIPVLQPNINSQIAVAIQKQIINNPVPVASVDTAMFQSTESYTNNPVGVVDVDPFTPGVQATPGVVVQTGPTRVVGGSIMKNNNVLFCLLPLIGLLLLALLIAGLYYCFKPKRQEEERFDSRLSRPRYVLACTNGYELNGKCVTCPTGSQWNGQSCSYVQDAQNNVIRSIKVDATESVETTTTSLLPTIVNTSVQTSSMKKIGIFDKDSLRSQVAVPTQQGVEPSVIQTSPIRAKPNVVVDSPNSLSQTDFVSTNIVDVSPIVSKKVTQPIYTRV